MRHAGGAGLMRPTRPSGHDAFAATRARVEEFIHELEDAEAAALSHAELEELIAAKGREVQRQLLQDHLDLRSLREQRCEEVVDAAGVARRTVEPHHQRTLTTIVGDVRVERLSYRQRGHANLCPADAHLNLLPDQYSHGLRRKAAIEVSRGSFAAAVDAIHEATGQCVGKRQVEALAETAAQDFAAFYGQVERTSAEGDALILSLDAKGIVMRPDALRPATAAAAERSAQKLATRLSPGEKSNRKRMAEVGAVYDVTPVPRTPSDILRPRADSSDKPTPAPTAKGKWLVASVAQTPATVIASVFDEAERRDPKHLRDWVVLVDGNSDQIHCVQAQAQARHVQVPILLDFIHVLEYLWGAAWCFFPTGCPDAELWVQEKGRDILDGKAALVAAAIRRKATCLHLRPEERKNADKCADYLHNKLAYLDYPTALSKGWPIATGVIEGACRHLVKDRMDITGAR